MNRQIRRSLLLGALIAPLILAQSDSGRISGTITDASSAVVPNAPVTVKNERTGQARKVTANGQGVYLVTQLGPSTYTVTAEATGMAPAENSGVALQVGQERTLNITVQPASRSEEHTSELQSLPPHHSSDLICVHGNGRSDRNGAV